MELLDKQADGGTDKGVDVAAVADLAEELKDVILDYQVCTHITKQTPEFSLMQPTVLAAEGDLQSKLYIDCE